MTRRITSLVLASLLGAATVASAQTTDPIPRFVVDVRGTSAGLPTSLGWTPRIPEGTEVPSRGLGIEGGVHVFVLRGRVMSLGVGATWLLARGSTSTVLPENETPTVPLPDVSTRMTVLAPQLSLNFGKQLGWSYISAGLGRGKVSSSATATNTAEVDNAVPDWTRAVNFGGGARWFVNEHVGVGFDLRWHQFAAKENAITLALAPRETVMVFGIGIAIR
jgi:hypothetical protein